MPYPGFRHGLAEPDWAFCISSHHLKEFIKGKLRSETCYTRASHNLSHQTSSPRPGTGGKTTDASLQPRWKSLLVWKPAVGYTVGMEPDLAQQSWWHLPQWDDLHRALMICAEKRYQMPLPQAVHIHCLSQLWRKPTHRRAWPACRPCKDRRSPSVAKLCCWAVSNRRQAGRCPIGPFREFTQVRGNSSRTCSPAPTFQSLARTTQQNWLDLVGKRPPNTMDP